MTLEPVNIRTGMPCEARLEINFGHIAKETYFINEIIFHDFQYFGKIL